MQMVQPDLFHYGGGMAFGKDGKLYFTIGERYYNENEQPDLPVAQDLNDKRGKIHRLNDDGSIPKDNPDFGTGKISSIYALGIRAAQGITLDTETGALWFSEHGSVQGDELNLLQKGHSPNLYTIGLRPSHQRAYVFIEDQNFFLGKATLF